uniref:Small ribosomal subunit protein mS35 mitochondrial conserved domain-containing protein n=1 Tax=Candidozyma auris TaxID=498019 RepID=A0A0L0P014_CANAR
MISRASHWLSRAARLQAVRLKSGSSVPQKAESLEDLLYLNPHKWEGLPADRIFELHRLRKTKLGEKYAPTDSERLAVLKTFALLKGKVRPQLEYVYEVDHFKERLLNNVVRPPVPQQANRDVRPSGEEPHLRRKFEQLHAISAHEMPLLAKYRQEYKPRAALETPLQLKFFTDLSDDMLSPENRKVALNVALEDLGLSEKQAHKFKVLAGNKFNHKNNVFHMKTARYGVATQNAKWLVETFNKLLAESKDLSKELLEDIPVNTHHCPPRKSQPQFPEEWKRPQDAPVEKNRILSKVIDMVIAQKDQEYLKELTP